MTISPKWNAQSLQVQSDPRWRARYRLLQSWFRETHLHEQPGEGPRAKLVGSMLTEEAGRAGKNLLSKEVIDYVGKRVPEVKAVNGTIDEDRLRRNMLSSMPLCFNLFGHLRQYPDEAAAILKNALGLDIAKVEGIECEWAPDPEQHLHDRTAFDAFVEYRTVSGTRGCLGIETKYTEPFSTTEYDDDIYRQRTCETGSGFKVGAAEKLIGKATNQLWRNVLLTLSLRRHEKKYEAGHTVVMACRDDAAAATAVQGVRDHLHEPDALVRFVALEDLVERAAGRPALAKWAALFRRRYLDLGPVQAHLR